MAVEGQYFKANQIEVWKPSQSNFPTPIPLSADAPKYDSLPFDLSPPRCTMLSCINHLRQTRMANGQAPQD